MSAGVRIDHAPSNLGVRFKGDLMLTKPSELMGCLEALKVLIRNGDLHEIGLAEEIIRVVVKREPALRAKTDVLDALRQGIGSHPKASAKSLAYAEVVLEFIAKMLREFQQ
jgi:hypothetical protein